MNQKALAKHLRRRQLRTRLAPRSSIHALNDQEILDAYLVCWKCRGELFADRAAAVRGAKDTAEFLTLCEMVIASHNCQNRN